MTDQPTRITGYHRVEILGRHVIRGYVTTEFFGGVAFFHVVMPEREPEEVVLQESGWVYGERLFAGSRIRVTKRPVDQWVGAGSIYRLTPCSEAEARAAQPGTMEVLERAEAPQLAGVTTEEHYEQDYPEDDEGLDDDDDRPL